jgi:hypothetical protein
VDGDSAFLPPPPRIGDALTKDLDLSAAARRTSVSPSLIDFP